jgi:hypothetical protein
MSKKDISCVLRDWMTKLMKDYDHVIKFKEINKQLCARDKLFKKYFKKLEFKKEKQERL